MNRLLLTCGFLLLCCVMFCGSVMAQPKTESVLAADKEAVTLSIGIPPSRRPYAYVNKQKEPAGILVDKIRTICESMKVTCDFVAGGSDQLIKDLQGVKLNAILIVDDFVMPELDKLQLTQPLCRARPAFVQKKTDPERSKPEDFRGTTIGVKEGSIFHVYLLDEYSNQARLKPYPFMDNAIFDIVFGRLDVLFAEEAFIESRMTATALNGYVDFTVKTLEIPDLPTTAMTLALRGQDNDLFKQFETALQATQSATTPCVKLLATQKTN